ncbi:MAG: hypothetical protein ACRCSX_03480 [Allorhizobium sp.]
MSNIVWPACVRPLEPVAVAKQIVAEQGFELARAARDGSEDDVREAGSALGQAITNAMMEVFDGLTEGVSD